MNNQPSRWHCQTFHQRRTIPPQSSQSRRYMNMRQRISCFTLLLIRAVLLIFFRVQLFLQESAASSSETSPEKSTCADPAASESASTFSSSPHVTIHRLDQKGTLTPANVIQIDNFLGGNNLLPILDDITKRPLYTATAASAHTNKSMTWIPQQTSHQLIFYDSNYNVTSGPWCLKNSLLFRL